MPEAEREKERERESSEECGSHMHPAIQKGLSARVLVLPSSEVPQVES